MLRYCMQAAASENGEWWNESLDVSIHPKPLCVFFFVIHEAWSNKNQYCLFMIIGCIQIVTCYCAGYTYRLFNGLIVHNHWLRSNSDMLKHCAGYIIPLQRFDFSCLRSVAWGEERIRHWPLSTEPMVYPLVERQEIFFAFYIFLLFGHDIYNFTTSCYAPPGKVMLRN